MGNTCACFWTKDAKRLVRLDFRVEGKAQGHQEAGRPRNNAEDGSVEGRLEGEAGAVDEMKRWLAEAGSPRSRIDRAVFGNEEDVSEYAFEDEFVIKK